MPGWPRHALDERQPELPEHGHEPCAPSDLHGPNGPDRLRTDLAALLGRQRSDLLLYIDRSMRQQEQSVVRLFTDGPLPDALSPRSSLQELEEETQSDAPERAEPRGRSPSPSTRAEERSADASQVSSLGPASGIIPPDLGDAEASATRSTTQVSTFKPFSNGHSYTTRGRLSAWDTERRNTAMALAEAKKQDEEAASERLRKATTTVPFHRALRHRLKALVSRTEFEVCSFLVIGLNVVMVGVEVDYVANHSGDTDEQIFVRIEEMFTALFLLELVLKISANGSGFFCGQYWAWNWFDCLLVLSSVFEVSLRIIKASVDVEISHIRVFRVFRITRMLRTFRMLRLVRFIRALRTLLYSIVVTLKSLVWALLLMLLIFYGFGVAFTQATVDHIYDSPDELGLSSTADTGYTAATSSTQAACRAGALATFWGTLPRSMFTLFKSISGGISWHEVALPLARVSPIWVAVFVAFFAFFFFAVLNVVTGVFCQSAIESAQQDKDIATMQLLVNNRTYVNSVTALFHEVDDDHSGTVTIQEFERFLTDDRYKASFAALDIDPSDPWTLFKLLDTDEVGCVDMQKFVTGCVQLRGPAKAIHMAKMAYDNRLMRKMMEEFMDAVEERFEAIIRWAGLHGSQNNKAEDVKNPLPDVSHSSPAWVGSRRRRRVSCRGSSGLLSIPRDASPRSGVLPRTLLSSRREPAGPAHHAATAGPVKTRL